MPGLPPYTDCSSLHMDPGLHQQLQKDLAFLHLQLLAAHICCVSRLCLCCPIREENVFNLFLVGFDRGALESLRNVLAGLGLLLLLLRIKTQPHLGCCLAAATAAASAIFMHLCTNSTTPYTSRQHMRSCNELNVSCANRRSRLTTAVAGHEKSGRASSSTERSCIPKAAHRLQPRTNRTTP
jgi:hypothetical protein